MDLDIENILKRTKVGIWSIVIENNKFKMYGNKSFIELLGANLGANIELSPEDIYKLWFSGVHPNYIEYIYNAIEEAFDKGEVVLEYLWNHSKLGLMYIRSHAVLESDENGIKKISGYHQEVARNLHNNIDNLDNYKILDIYKVLKYSKYFMYLCEKLYEIDIETLNTKTIFYKDDRYDNDDEDRAIDELIEKYVHEENKNSFKELFYSYNIEKMVNNKSILDIEYRSKTIDDNYKWTKAILFAVEFNKKKKILLYTYDIEKEKKTEKLEEQNKEILDAFIADNYAILEMNLELENINIVKKGKNVKTIIKDEASIEELKELLVENYVDEFDKEKIEKFFSLDSLKHTLSQEKGTYIDVKLNNKLYGYKWMRLKILPVSILKKKVYLFIKTIDKDSLIGNIIGKYIYDNYDYLYYIDFKNDYFFKFGETSQVEIGIQNDNCTYSTQLQKYVDKFVVKEDIKNTIRKMSKDYIIEQLDKKHEFTFTNGIIDNNGEYKRKAYKFQYLNREHQIVMAIKQDITNSYKEKLEKENELKKVSFEAKTDFLTGVLNRKGLEKEINQYLRQDGNKGMFIIVDLDNFKLVNDRCGHDEGDNVIKKVANILKDNFRRNDVVGRLGGDEFVVFIKGSYKTSIESLAQKILNNIHFSYKTEEEFTVTASVGITYYEGNGEGFEELYKKADNALYEAKKSGKNKYCIN